MASDDKATTRAIAAEVLKQVRAAGSAPREALSDDMWRAFWARVRSTTSLFLMAILTALTLLSTLVVNLLKIWDRLFQG